MNPSDAVTREPNPLAQLANEPAGSIAGVTGPLWYQTKGEAQHRAPFF